MIKNILQSTLKYIKRISYVYIAYRILNILIVIAVAGMNVVTFQTDSTTSYTNFEWPAPNLNNVITYDTLAWCHKCLISENNFNNYSDYETMAGIVGLLDISFILLPWTIQMNPFSPYNEEDRHQYNSRYDIDVWCGYNVFSGKYEQIFFYYDNLIMLLPIWIVYVIISLIYDLYGIIRKMCQKAIQKQ